MYGITFTSASIYKGLIDGDGMLVQANEFVLTINVFLCVVLNWRVWLANDGEVFMGEVLTKLMVRQYDERWSGILLVHCSAYNRGLRVRQPCTVVTASFMHCPSPEFLLNTGDRKVHIGFIMDNVTSLRRWDIAQLTYINDPVLYEFTNVKPYSKDGKLEIQVCCLI